MHNLQWQPGQYGKGYVDEDGSVVTWVTDGPYGGPHHAEVATGDISDTAMVQRDFCGFEIGPDGTVGFSMLSNPKDPRRNQILQADPRLHNPNQDMWTFTSEEHPHAQWQQGNYGKGILFKDGTIHSWNLADNTHDGWPSHLQYYMSNVLGDPGPYASDEAILDSADRLDAMSDTSFWISPDGTVTIPGEAPHRPLERSLRKAHPDAQLEYQDWQFESSVHQGNDAAFATELRLWLDQVDEQLRATSDPTPHHDRPEDLVQQPGFVSRIKHALKPKPKTFERKTPEEEYEEQKEEWAEREDGWGWPTRNPYQEQPWRTH